MKQDERWPNFDWDIFLLMLWRAENKHFQQNWPEIHYFLSKYRLEFRLKSQDCGFSDNNNGILRQLFEPQDFTCIEHTRRWIWGNQAMMNFSNIELIWMDMDMEVLQKAWLGILVFVQSDNAAWKPISTIFVGFGLQTSKNHSNSSNTKLMKFDQFPRVEIWISKSVQNSLD